jgi:electron transport complex protein RnfG
MKKLESTLPNMFIVLTAIALISAIALAYTYRQTKPVLDEQARRRQIQAVAQVTPEFDNLPTEEARTVAEFPDVVIYPAVRDGGRVGTAVRSYSENGYNGRIEVMVGFDETGEITGTTVLTHTETPGLGAKLTDESFRSQFVGMQPNDAGLTVESDGGEVDSITAATISSRAFVEAINRAWRAVEAARDAGPGTAGEWQRGPTNDIDPSGDQSDEPVAMRLRSDER